MQLVFILEQVVNGLVLGGYYLLIALGLSLIFSVGGVVNLSHGAFYALGAYVSVELTKVLGFGPAVALSPVAVGLLGILFERFILRRFYRADPILSLLVTFGLAMVAEQTIRIIWGAAPIPASMPGYMKGPVILGDFLFSQYRLLLLAVVVVVLTGIWYLLQRTEFGRVVRAGIQQPDMVAALGIRLQPYMTAVVVLGVGMAALGGALFAQMNGFADITIGTGTIVVGLAAVIAGEAIFRVRGVVMAVVACIFGSIIYRLAIAFALNADYLGLTSADLNLVTAVLVALALILPGARNPLKTLLAKRNSGSTGGGGA